MRVLHVIPAIAPCYGGPSKVVLDTCKALREEGIEADIATTNADEPSNFPIPKTGAAILDGVPVFFFMRQPQWRYKFSWGLTKWLKKNTPNYDLLHIHAVFSYSTAAAAFYARKFSVPYVILPHGMLAPWPVRKNWILKKFYLKLIEQRNLEEAAAVHFTAEEELRMSVVSGRSNFVLPCVIALKDCSNDARGRMTNRCPRILFLSRIDPKKGIDLLISALSQLKRDGKNFELTIAGSGKREYELEIEEMVIRADLSPCTRLRGFVEGAEKTALFESADLFVLPSHHENFGIAVAEAMRFGLPVVITDKVNIHHEILNANAGLVVPPKVEELSAAIGRLLDNPSLMVEMGANGKNLVEKKFSSRSVTRDTVQVYFDIIKQSRESAAWR